MYNSKIKSAAVDELFGAIIKLNSLDDCYRFFDDLCTINEVLSFAQRLQVAKMLLEQRTYQFIAGSMDVSTATISRIKRCLDYGADGYKLVLSKEIKENDNV
jgi:TrpR-related protein YerC/YecD